MLLLLNARTRRPNAHGFGQPAEWTTSLDDNDRWLCRSNLTLPTGSERMTRSESLDSERFQAVSEN
jgi:hypothetical protein